MIGTGRGTPSPNFKLFRKKIMRVFTTSQQGRAYWIMLEQYENKVYATKKNN